jgi:hypothetical protein
MTGNIKESLIPYILANMKQLKIIDKINKESLKKKPNEELQENLFKLRRYAANYLNLNSKIHMSDQHDDEEPLDQPEVENLMPNVIKILLF